MFLYCAYIRTFANTATAIIDPVDGADMIALTRKRLIELERLRDFAFVQLNRVNDATLAMPGDQLLGRLFGPKATMAEYDRFSRAVRQITVLEFELRGLFKAPDRDTPRKARLVKSDRPGFVPPILPSYDPFSDLDCLAEILDIRTYYRNGPLEEVVAGIRQTLGAEPPPDDPFAPVGRKAQPKAAPEPTAAAPQRGPEYYMRSKPLEPAEPEPAQNAPAMKAATMVIHNLGNKGFRQPSKAQLKKHRQSRGPPK